MHWDTDHRTLRLTKTSFLCRHSLLSHSSLFQCLLVLIKIIFIWILTNVSSWSHHQFQRQKSKVLAAAGVVGIVDHAWWKEARGKGHTSSRHKTQVFRGPGCWSLKCTKSHSLVMCSLTRETEAQWKLLSKITSSQKWICKSAKTLSTHNRHS